MAFEDLIGNVKEELNKLYQWIGFFEKDEDYIQKVVSTRDPWDYNGRIMPGLRYFDCIKHEKNNLILNKNQIKFINDNIKKCNI